MNGKKKGRWASHSVALGLIIGCFAVLTSAVAPGVRRTEEEEEKKTILDDWGGQS